MAYSVLVTDTSTAVGKVLEEELTSSDIQVLSLNLSDSTAENVCDIQAKLTQCNPDMVINTYGWSDKGERLLDLPVVPVTQTISQYCSDNNKVLMQLSNYRVFSGTKSGFLESDEIEPRDSCGTVFAELEKIVAEVERHILLRLSWVIGATGENLMTTISESLWRGNQADIHAERRGAPVGHCDIARIVTAVVKQVSCGSQNWGIFHYSSADVCTEEELAEEISERLKSERDTQGMINDISDAEAKPYSAALGYRRLMDNFGIQPRTWRQGLNLELTTWLAQRSEHKIKE
ncbi:sugar nucleotide-binding protein [Sessilibacter corallicola]|uniref:sugar nucleotide-binding protein n=1 Tax=Sessilibacter corallicola TaxID=2904075 RepID=UPI001E4E58B6|nr:sugar nucleotide-binding protein [Sessilibacter corallicola]MCE2027355.1 NAD(P)-dependent oxidoreductase [Sessilibacter corallicola]